MQLHPLSRLFQPPGTLVVRMHSSSLPASVLQFRSGRPASRPPNPAETASHSSLSLRRVQGCWSTWRIIIAILCNFVARKPASQITSGRFVGCESNWSRHLVEQLADSAVALGRLGRAHGWACRIVSYSRTRFVQSWRAKWRAQEAFPRCRRNPGCGLTYGCPLSGSGRCQQCRGRIKPKVEKIANCVDLVACTLEMEWLGAEARPPFLLPQRRPDRGKELLA